LNFFKKRLLLFREKEVKGGIIADIGIGVFANALFSLTQENYSYYIFLDIIFGIMLIVEGNLLKKDSICKK